MWENMSILCTERSKPSSKCTVRQYEIRIMNMRLEHECARQIRLKEIGCPNSTHVGPRHEIGLGGRFGGATPMRSGHRALRALAVAVSAATWDHQTKSVPPTPNPLPPWQPASASDPNIFEYTSILDRVTVNYYYYY